MNAPIEEQLHDYFTMVDRLQGPIDPVPQSQNSPTLTLITEDTNDTNDTNDSTTEVIMISTDRNEPDNRSRTWMLVAASIAAVALVGGLLVAATRDSNDAPADTPVATLDVPDTAAVTAPQTTAVDGEAAPVPETEAPTETTPTATTMVESEFEVLASRFDQGRFLDGGTSYRSELFDQQVAFTIPEEHGDSNWIAGVVEPQFLTLVALLAPEGDSGPSLEISPVAEGVTVDDVIESITTYAAGNDNLDVAAERQTVRGTEATVLRGRSSSADTNTEVQLVPTSSTTAFSIAPGEELVVYVIEGPSQVIVARIVNAEADMAWAVERIAPVVESIEFP